MRRISAWAITHPVFPLVLFAVLFVFGVVAFVRLPITLNPDISAPFVQITISEPGAAPSEIEKQILQRVEGAVAGIGNVKHITSWATEGVARTFAGRVWQVGSVIDPATRQGTVRIALRSPDRDLRPGAFAHADIRVGRTQGSLLPETAVLTDDKGAYVLVVGRDDKIERRRVRVAAARSDGVLVDDGLRGTERVVAIAGAFLHPGEAVLTAKAGRAATS